MLGIVRVFWGDMSKEELKKFLFLGFIFMLAIGNYWMMRSLKNALFGKFVDFQMYLPWAKFVSLAVIALLLIGYSKLVDIFSKDKLFYMLCPFLGLWTIGLSYCVANPHVVSLSEMSVLYPYFAWIPGKALGWVCYVSLEFVSIIQILLWAFVASTTKTESAKKGYGFIMFIVQIGTISGSAFVAKYAGVGIGKLSVAGILAIGGCVILILPLIFGIYNKVIPQDDVDTKLASSAKKTGFLEGIKLILTRPYVAGVFVVATMYEVIGTILEFQMNSLGRIIYPIAEDFAAFNGKYGIGVNTLALTFALLGTSFLMRKYGLRFCLIVFPTIVAVIISGVFMFKFVGTASNYVLMWVLFAGMVGIKGLNYALGNPTKETMYIPTSKDVRFKSKGWIEVFGGRTTKAGGSGVNLMFKESLSSLLFYGSIISLGLVGVWILIAAMVGKKFEKLQKDGTIIE